MVSRLPIHLIRTDDVSPALYREVLDLLQRNEGPLSFTGNPGELSPDDDDTEDYPFVSGEHDHKKPAPPLLREPEAHAMLLEDFDWKPRIPKQVRVITWQKLFDLCQAYRSHLGVSGDEHVVLITGLANDLNWFAGSDERALNHFVHTDQWDMFLPCHPRFPVAYEVAVCVLRRLMFDNYLQAEPFLHHAPRGCVNDFCMEKKQITLKLRTGDICHDCLAQIGRRSVPPPIVDQVLRLLGSIRTQMLFTDRYRSTQRPSRLEVRGRDRRIFFTDLADAELRLTPLEKTLYLLFLKEADGLLSHELYDYRDWIRETYLAVGQPRTLADMENSINQLTDRTENSASEKISRIKRKIISLTGEELARHYTIEGPTGGKRRIALDRELLNYR